MELINNNYQIDGLNVLDMCKKYDSPLYVYETKKMEANIISKINADKVLLPLLFKNVINFSTFLFLLQHN